MGRALNLGLVAFVVVVTTGATGCSPRTAQPPPTPSPNAAAPAISATKAEYTKALAAAKGWQSNATLTRVYRTYNGSLEPTEPRPLIFSFSSLADPKQSFTLATTADGDDEKRVPKLPFELALQPVDTGSWEVDPERALKVAEDNGGKAFREQHLAGYTVLQQLAKSGNYPLQWLVRYDTGDGSQMRLSIYVNASTGAVDSKKEQRL